jgi:hypothetical protein
VACIHALLKRRGQSGPCSGSHGHTFEHLAINRLGCHFALPDHLPVLLQLRGCRVVRLRHVITALLRQWGRCGAPLELCDVVLSSSMHKVGV